MFFDNALKILQQGLSDAAGIITQGAEELYRSASSAYNSLFESDKRVREFNAAVDRFMDLLEEQSEEFDLMSDTFKKLSLNHTHISNKIEKLGERYPKLFKTKSQQSKSPINSFEQCRAEELYAQLQVLLHTYPKLTETATLSEIEDTIVEREEHHQKVKEVFALIHNSSNETIRLAQPVIHKYEELKK